MSVGSTEIFTNFAMQYEMVRFADLKPIRQMCIEKIGENAGLIWNALQGGALTTKALKKATKLKEADLNLALGWLAREDKLNFEENEADTVIALR